MSLIMFGAAWGLAAAVAHNQRFVPPKSSEGEAILDAVMRFDLALLREEQVDLGAVPVPGPPNDIPAMSLPAAPCDLMEACHHATRDLFMHIDDDFLEGDWWYRPELYLRMSGPSGPGVRESLLNARDAPPAILVRDLVSWNQPISPPVPLPQQPYLDMKHLLADFPAQGGGMIMHYYSPMLYGDRALVARTKACASGDLCGVGNLFLLRRTSTDGPWVIVAVAITWVS